MSPSSAAKNALRYTTVARVKNLFLKGVLGVYIAAFASLYVQVQPLFGDNGVVPVKDFLSGKFGKVKNSLDSFNLVLLAPLFKLDYGTFMELLCLLAILVAFVGLITKRVATTLPFAFLWYIYYSIVQVGQGFMTFHSDLLLLEVGFLAIFLASVLPQSRGQQADHDHLTFFLVRWMVFKFFLVSVISAYTDNDNAWYDLSILPKTAQAAPIPSLVNWHVFNLNKDIYQMAAAFACTLKLTVPFLFFVPLKHVRLFAFYTMLSFCLFYTTILGFGWFHILMAVALLSVLRDGYLFNDNRVKYSKSKTLLDFVVLFAYIGAITYVTVDLFGIAYVKGALSFKVHFNPSHFRAMLTYLIPAAVATGVLSFFANFYKTWFGSSGKTPLVKNFIYSGFSLLIFLASFQSLIRYHQPTEKHLSLITRDIHQHMAPLKVSNNYVLLSKVSQFSANGRPELLIQGRATPESQSWDLFDLRYKPGYQAKPLSFVNPHLPRLDLKMWYAARSGLANNNWLYTFVYRLATMDKVALKAISPHTYMTKAPAQVRVALYNYKFASSSKPTSKDGYWSETKFISEYLPLTTAEALKYNVKFNGIDLSTSSRQKNDGTPVDLFKKYLEMTSDYARNVDQRLIIWTIFVGSSLLALLR